MVFEVLEEPPHMVLVVGRNQGEGDGEVAERVGGQEQGAMAQMEFVDTQGAGEMVEGPLAVAGHVDLANLPVEAVGEEAIGQIEVELPLHRLLQAMEAHAVIEEAIDDDFADAVGVAGSGFDAFDVGSERLAAVAGGAVFSHGQLDDDDFAQGDVADESCVGVLASSLGAALGAGEGLRGATLSKSPNTGGFHACVLFGLVW